MRTCETVMNLASSFFILAICAPPQTPNPREHSAPEYTCAVRLRSRTHLRQQRTWRGRMAASARMHVAFSQWEWPEMQQRSKAEYATQRARPRAHLLHADRVTLQVLHLLLQLHDVGGQLL